MAGPKYIMSDKVYCDEIREIITNDLGTGSDEPAQILPHVLLGSQRNAESLRLIRKYGVTHVLNCAGFKGPKIHPEVITPYEGLNIDYVEITADDSEHYDITQHFGQAFAYLDGVKRCKGVCLVHCALGINRSAAICVAYLMHSKTWSILRAMKAIRPKRKVMLSNEGFRRQLVRWARSQNLLDPMRDPEREKQLAIREDDVLQNANRDYERMFYNWRTVRSPPKEDLDDLASQYSKLSTGSGSLGSRTYSTTTYDYSSSEPRSRTSDRLPGDFAVNYLYDKFMNRDKI